MKNFKTPLLILAVLLLLPLAALAAPVGKITYVEGSVDITAGDKVRTAVLGEPVNAGEVLRSKAKAKAEVTFLDGNILRLAEGTRVRITEYQSGDGKSTTLDLFRGKTQNIVSGLAKGARYEVHTPTAVCGVRGTNFFTFIQNGASYFVPKENTIYGYNKNRPSDVKTVNPGLAIVIPDANQPAVIQPASTIDLDKHSSDTAPGGQAEDKDKKKDAEGSGGASVPLPMDPPIEINLAEVNLGETMTRDDWTFNVRGGDVKYIMQVWFPFEYPPPPEVVSAQGTMIGGLFSETGLGTVDMTLQYATGNTPQLEVGVMEGQMQDGSGVTGLITSVPGSWNGAFSGLYQNDGGMGLYLGYLSGNFNETTGLLVTNGMLTRTAPLMPPDPRAIFLPDQLNWLKLFVAPMVDYVNVFPVNVNGKSSYAAFLSGYGVPNTNDLTYSKLATSDNTILSAWAVVNDGEYGMDYDNSAERTSWTAKYGDWGFSLLGEHFVVGDITGTHPVNGTVTDFDHLKLSGRDLLFISSGEYGFNDFGDYEYTPGLMGPINFEYWANLSYDGSGYSEDGGGAGTIELKPTAFGGTWGNGPASLYANETGYALRAGEEYGAIAAWTAPWDSPAHINVAGLYGSFYGNYYDISFAPSFLMSSPVGSRMIWTFEDDPRFHDGDFFGLAAGAVGPVAQTEKGTWERATRAAMAALYAKDGKAGFLTTFTPGTAEGGLTGGFYPNSMEDDWWNFFRLDGTLTATPKDTSPSLSNHTLRYAFADDIRVGYAGTGAAIQGDAGLATYFFNAYDASRSGTYDRPWGIFGLSIGGKAEFDGDGITTTGNPAWFSGPVSDLNGQDISVGGGSEAQEGKASFWQGTIGAAAWTETIPGEGYGEISGPLSGRYLSETDMGTFEGVFYGLYDAPNSAGGTWIGDAVGTYSGTPLTFGGKLRETVGEHLPYGLSGLWGSVDAIGDGAASITGILAMGKYTTLPTGAWSARSGGKWTTSSGAPAYWMANVAGGAFSEDAFEADLSEGRYISLLGEGTVASSFGGSYNATIGTWMAENVAFTLTQTQSFARSGRIRVGSYGIDGIWGSTEAGVLAMGQYATIPTLSWSETTGGRWTATTGNPVYWTANVGGGAWADGGFTVNLTAGKYISLEGEGTLTPASPIDGLYYPDINMWTAENDGFTLTQTQAFGFSSAIEGETYTGISTSFDIMSSGFHGIMGGLNGNIFEPEIGTGTSVIHLRGYSDWAPNPLLPATALSASQISSYAPGASAFTGAYHGALMMAADTTGAVTGDIRALYAVSGFSGPAGGFSAEGFGGYGGYSGILYSDDITGTSYPGVGAWEATGNLTFYPMSDYTVPGIISMSLSGSYGAGEVPVDVISGGTPYLRRFDTAIQSYVNEPWGIWQSVTGGTYDGGNGSPLTWITREENISVVVSGNAGVNGAQHLMYNLGAPVNDVSTGTVVGVQAVWDTSGETESHTVVMGGVVKGIFDPNTTPLTWTAISQGAFMRTDAFLDKVGGMSDIERANFERATKIPSFDVGMANLSGSVSDMSVAMNNITFFRGQGESTPSLWATKEVTGSYSSSTKDYTGTTVTLGSTSASLVGLTQNFTVQQWQTTATSGNWGASVSTVTPGTLTRSVADQGRLPGASTTITINSMNGLAGGSITPNLSTPGGTFAGTAAGTVVATTPVVP